MRKSVAVDGFAAQQSINDRLKHVSPNAAAAGRSSFTPEMKIFFCFGLACLFDKS
jgi:hypothetical protein